MYNFLEKLITIISFYDYPVKVQKSSIQLSMPNMSNQIIRDHKRRLLVAKYELE